MILKYFLYALLFCCLLFLPLSAQAKSLPSWVNNPIQSSTHLHAVGEGFTLNLAEKAAQVALGAQISTTVSEYFRSIQIQQGDYFREITELTTHSEVTNVWISGAKITERQKVGTTWYVMAQLSYAHLGSQQLQILQRAVNQIAPFVQQSAAPSFVRWWQLRQLGGLVVSAESAKTIMASYMPQEHLNSDLINNANELLRRYHEEMHTLRSAVAMRIVNLSRYEPFASNISRQLSRENLQVTRKKNAMTGTVKLMVNDTRQRFGNEIHIHRTLIVQLIDGVDVLAEVSLSDKGVSLSKSHTAKNMASKRLESALTKQQVIAKLFEQI